MIAYDRRGAVNLTDALARTVTLATTSRSRNDADAAEYQRDWFRL